MKIVVAIDGPAASGKSSVARRVSKRLGISYIDSGAFYRAITWWVLRANTDPAAVHDVSAIVAESQLESGFEGDEGTSGSEGLIRGRTFATRMLIARFLQSRLFPRCENA